MRLGHKIYKTMAKIKITASDGKVYPCRMTNGAMLRFKHETGRDVSAMDGGMADDIILIWCCVASACVADGIEFNYSCEEFSDRVDIEELQSFNVSMQADAVAGAKKKTEKK